MARDTKDSLTVDAFPAKKRGRRPTGTAKTAAERMALKRARDAKAVNTARTKTDYRNLTTVQLMQAMASAVDLGVVKTVRLIGEVLAERAQQNFDAQ
jgi:predicted deacetylase